MVRTVESKKQLIPESTMLDGEAGEIEKDAFNITRKVHWNNRAELCKEKSVAQTYHQFVRNLYGKYISDGQKVLEIGCFRGDLLASLSPSLGVGIDFSIKAIEGAEAKYPHLTFYCCDAHELPELQQTFDYIILSDLINDLYDVQCVLAQIKPFCHDKSRIIINFQNFLWSVPIRLGRKWGLAYSQMLQNWFTFDDLKNLLVLSGYDVVKRNNEILFPFKVPLLKSLLNKYVARVWPLSNLCLTHFIVARPRSLTLKDVTEKNVSIIIAARNEAGHIQKILDRVPVMGSGTELIFVEGGSSDGTFETVEKAISSYTRMPVRLFKQSGKGKGDAVRLGFEKAQNDILMILDADLTVMPEDLPRFYEALIAGTGDFINGVRLVYPMEDKAMRFLNLVGNKLFSLGFSYTLGQPVKDTLCGTKVLYRCDYKKIAENRYYFGDFDPYGDFDLIFGAAKQNFKIVDLPVRYQARVYGETNINRWEGGWLLLKMLLVALKKLKFV